MSQDRVNVSVAETDPAIRATTIHYKSNDCDMSAYLVRPASAGQGRLPAMIVVHENRGLNEHIKDVARRLARAGYVTIAPDLLSKLGGTDKVAAAGEVPDALRNLTPEMHMENMRATLEQLKAQPDVRADRIGCTGFCFGGGITWRFLTIAGGDLKAGVPFYGTNPPLEDINRIRASIYAMYGENDARINAGMDAIVKSMADNKKEFAHKIFPGAAHAFNNDKGASYHPEAAEQAWKLTLDFLAKNLKN